MRETERKIERDRERVRETERKIERDRERVRETERDKEVETERERETDGEAICLFGFLTSSSTTKLYRGRAPRQSV